jgi:glutamine amidotransferase PdxT
MSSTLRRKLHAALAFAALLLPAVPLAAQSSDGASGNPQAGFLPLPKLARPVRAAIYEGAGSQDSGIRDVEQGVKLLEGASIARLRANDFSNQDLAGFDVVIFSAGGATTQARAIGDAGRTKIREFVKAGGAYLGICAGAYLACAEFDWGLQLVAAETLSDKWERGVATVGMQLTAEGREAFGRVDSPLRVSYENGPVIGPIKRKGLPAYRTLAIFATEVAENGSPAGIMVGSPALVEARYGAGRAMIFSPHPERTEGLERFVPLAIARLASTGDMTTESESVE